MRKPYILYQRVVGGKGGRVYYVAYWDEECYRYTHHRSTGETRKTYADAIARKWLAEGVPLRDSQLFLGYLSAFWLKGSDYLRRREARGHRLSAIYLAGSRSAIDKHLRPYLEQQHKEGLPLAKVTAGLLESFLMHLRAQGLSAARINGIRQAIAVPMSEALRLGYITVNPITRVERIPDKAPRREILTREEARAFFALEWEDPRHYAANLLAATTGMRLGEVRGLQAGDLVQDGEQWCIMVRHNWQDSEGLKQPKWDSHRQLPLPRITQRALQELAELNPWDDGFVFFGDKRGVPLSNTSIGKAFYQGLERIGIPEDARKRRHLTFHAWRHWYNSMLRGHIPDHALRKLTGHQAEAMTDRYSAITDEQRRAVAELGEKLF